MIKDKGKCALLGLRLSLGWLFFWAFIDKLFGLGFATTPDKSWIAGGSPTAGFLSFATTGPLAPMYKAMSGNVLVDVLFMLALLAIGVTMLLGVAVRLGSYIGALLAFMMWTALLLPKNNPILDEHIIYIFGFLVLSTTKATGQYYGLGKQWAKTKLVKKHPILE